MFMIVRGGGGNSLEGEKLPQLPFLMKTVRTPVPMRLVSLHIPVIVSPQPVRNATKSNKDMIAIIFFIYRSSGFLSTGFLLRHLADPGNILQLPVTYKCIVQKKLIRSVRRRHHTADPFYRQYQNIILAE